MDSKGGGRRCGSLEKLGKQTPICPLLLDAHVASGPWVAAPESGGAGGVVPAGAKATVGSAATSVGGRFTRDTCPAGDQGWVGAAVEGMGGALRPSQAQAPQAGWWASTWSYPDIPMHVHTRRRTHVYHAHKCTHRHIDTNTGTMHMCPRAYTEHVGTYKRHTCPHAQNTHACTHMRSTRALTHKGTHVPTHKDTHTRTRAGPQETRCQNKGAAFHFLSRKAVPPPPQPCDRVPDSGGVWGLNRCLSGRRLSLESEGVTSLCPPA